MATARRFALAMGMIAVIVVCVAGMWRQSPLAGTLLRALVALVVFAGIGYVCGLVGAAIMKDAVKTELTRAKDALEAGGLSGREARNAEAQRRSGEEPAGNRS